MENICKLFNIIKDIFEFLLAHAQPCTISACLIYSASNSVHNKFVLKLQFKLTFDLNKMQYNDALIYSIAF